MWFYHTYKQVTSNIKNMKIGKLEIILWIVATVTLIATTIINNYCICLSEQFSTLFTILYSLTTSSLAALTILALQRLDRKIFLDKIYKKDIGEIYTREFIDQYNTAPQHTQPLKDSNIGEIVKLTHLGDHILQVETKYWGEEIKGILEFNESSQFLATGTYRYINKSSTDVGTYKVHRFNDNKEILYVYYENTIPGNGAKGYEIWKRINKK